MHEAQSLSAKPSRSGTWTSSPTKAGAAVARIKVIAPPSKDMCVGSVTGDPVIALCGKVWVPGRDPEKFPVCPTCKEIYDGLRDPQDGED